MAQRRTVPTLGQCWTNLHCCLGSIESAYSFIKLLSHCSRTRTRLYQIEVPLERTTYQVELPSKKTTWGFNEDWIFQVDFSGLKDLFQVDFSGLKDLFVCDRDAQRSSVNVAGYLIEGLDKVASFLGVLLWGPSAPRPTLWEELHAHIRGTPLPQHGRLWREMWFGKPPVKTKTSLWEIVSDRLWEASGPKPGHFRLNTLSCSLQDFPSYLRYLGSGLYDRVGPVIVTVAKNLDRIIYQVGGKVIYIINKYLASEFLYLFSINSQFAEILVISSLGNGLSPLRRQAITWSNEDSLWTWPLRTKLSEICFKM